MINPELLRTLAQQHPQLVADYCDGVIKKQAEDSFYFFVRLFWDQVATSKLVDGWYLKLICDTLQNIRTTPKILCNIPPRCAKTLIFSVLFPAWLWITYPRLKIICSSYSLQSISVRDSIACRSVIKSPLYQKYWANVFQITQDTQYKFCNSNLGFRMATSTDSANIGEGADIIICDDLNNLNRVSEADFDHVKHWFTTCLSTRLNPLGWQAIACIQQRSNEQDISGFIIENNDGWHHLCLPWHFDKARKHPDDPRVRDGEPLNNLYTAKQIKELQGPTKLGPTGFAQQFNQLVVPNEGGLFKKHWFNRFTEDRDYYYLNKPILKNECHTFITTDLAISLKTSSDWSVFGTWTITPQGHLLLRNEYRDRIEGNNILKELKRLNNLYSPDAIYIEDVAFQKLVYDMLREANLPALRINPQGQDKRARSQVAQVMAECGYIWLPENVHKDWIEEIIQFPNGRWDDRVDVLSYACRVAKKYGISEEEAPMEETMLGQ